MSVLNYHASDWRNLYKPCTILIKKENNFGLVFIIGYILNIIKDETIMIKIVTDSTCDLPIEVIQAYDITVIPCYVNMNGKSYLDGVELSRVSFFEQLPDADP